MKPSINRTALCVALAALTMLSVFSSCEPNEQAGGTTLSTDKQESGLTVTAPGGTAEFQIVADMGWTIETTSSWFEFNVTEGKGNAYVTVYYDERIEFDSRDMTVTINGSEPGFTTSFLFKQFGLAPVLEFAKPAETAQYVGGSLALGLTTNLTAADFDVEIDYGTGPEDWITAHSLGNQVFNLTLAENTSLTDERSATITLVYTGEYADDLSTSIVLTQRANVIEPVTIPEAKALPVGAITDYIYVEGVVVAVGHGMAKVKYDVLRDYNVKKYRYYLQDTSGNSIVFASGTDDNNYAYNSGTAATLEPNALNVGMGDVIKLLLNGTAMTSQSDLSGFNFPVITGVTNDNILPSDTPMEIVPAQVGLDEITDAHVNTLVTLREVEVAIPVGYWNNFNRGWAQPKHANPSSSVADYVHKNPNFATLLRDRNGRQMHALADFYTTWTYGYNNDLNPFLPKGSGTLTGIVVREPHDRMGPLSTYQIRPRNPQDAAMDNEAFSGIIAEWDCAIPAAITGTETTLPLTSGSDTGATLFKSNGNKLVTSNDRINIFFVGDSRALDTGAPLSDGTILANGAVRAAGWSRFGELPASVGAADGDTWWLMSFSTEGVTSLVSVSFDSRSDAEGPAEFVAEYSLDNADWVKLGDYDAKGSLQSGFTGPNRIAGTKTYSFNLPSEANDKEKVYVRLRLRSDVNANGTRGLSDTQTNHLAHVVVKYTK